MDCSLLIQVFDDTQNIIKDDSVSRERRSAMKSDSGLELLLLPSSFLLLAFTSIDDFVNS